MLSKEEIEKIKAGQENAKKAGSKKMKLQPMTLKVGRSVGRSVVGQAASYSSVLRGVLRSSAPRSAPHCVACRHRP